MRKESPVARIPAVAGVRLRLRGYVVRECVRPCASFPSLHPSPPPLPTHSRLVPVPLSPTPRSGIARIEALSMCSLTSQGNRQRLLPKEREHNEGFQEISQRS